MTHGLCTAAHVVSFRTLACKWFSTQSQSDAFSVVSAFFPSVLRVASDGISLSSQFRINIAAYIDSKCRDPGVHKLVQAFGPPRPIFLDKIALGSWN